MTRVEKQSSVKEQIHEMKGVVVDEVRKSQRRRRPWLTCSVILLLLLSGFFVWLGWAVASTGLIEIPLLTSLAYDPPAPIRIVEPGSPIETVAQEVFTSTLTSRLQSGSGELLDRSMTLTLSESSLTATVQSLIEESGIGWIDSSLAQVVLDPSVGVELFAPLRNNPRGSAITLLADVGVQDGNVTITPTQAQIGDLTLPSVLLSLLNSLVQEQLESLNTSLRGYANLTSVSMTEGTVALVGELSVEIREP
jgi:hypothetical protein